jgi:hypothetical protein
MTTGETVVLLLLAVLFLAVVVSAMVIVFFRPWLILRGERDQHQEDLENADPEPRDDPETAAEASGGSEVPPDGAAEHRSWWRRYLGL